MYSEDCLHRILSQSVLLVDETKVPRKNTKNCHRLSYYILLPLLLHIIDSLITYYCLSYYILSPLLLHIIASLITYYCRTVLQK